MGGPRPSLRIERFLMPMPLHRPPHHHHVDENTEFVLVLRPASGTPTESIFIGGRKQGFPPLYPDLYTYYTYIQGFHMGCRHACHHAFRPMWARTLAASLFASASPFSSSSSTVFNCNLEPLRESFRTSCSGRSLLWSWFWSTSPPCSCGVGARGTTGVTVVPFSFFFAKICFWTIGFFAVTAPAPMTSRRDRWWDLGESWVITAWNQKWDVYMTHNIYYCNFKKSSAMIQSYQIISTKKGSAKVVTLDPAVPNMWLLWSYFNWTNKLQICFKPLMFVSWYPDWPAKKTPKDNC